MMAIVWEAERRDVWETYRILQHRSLVVAGSGNVSLRLPPQSGRELVAITPSKRGLHELTPADIVVVDFDGDPVDGERPPSIETMMHVAIYQARPEFSGVVHTHSVYASALAVAGLELPPILDELVVYTGGALRVAEYGFPSTEELAKNAVKALEGRSSALLRNHGLVAAGRTLAEAMAVCEVVEQAAHVYVLARLLGRGNPLPADVVEIEQNLYRMNHQQAQ